MTKYPFSTETNVLGLIVKCRHHIWWEVYCLMCSNCCSLKINAGWYCLHGIIITTKKSRLEFPYCSRLSWCYRSSAFHPAVVEKSAWTDRTVDTINYKGSFCEMQRNCYGVTAILLLLDLMWTRALMLGFHRVLFCSLVYSPVLSELKIEQRLFRILELN